MLFFTWLDCPILFVHSFQDQLRWKFSDLFGWHFLIHWILEFCEKDALFCETLEICRLILKNIFFVNIVICYLYVSFKQVLKVVCKTDSENCKPTTLFSLAFVFYGFTLCCCSMSRYSLFTFSCGYGFELINTVARCNSKWDRGCRYGPIPS